MAYVKNKWAIFNPEIPEDDQPDAFISLEKLENIENGIAAAHEIAATPGPKGDKGDTGEVGPQGEPGPAGKDGADGKDGEQGPQGEQGPAGKDGIDGKDGADGKDGVTPVKGEDYFTEDDKNEIVEAVLATQKNEPYFDEELNRFFACGVHINVYAADEAGKLKITWLDGKELIVPENIDIFGGCASADKVAYYPATSIAVYSGIIDGIMGGCFGNGLVGCTTIVINGGKINYACGAGMHWAAKNAHHNAIGHVDMVLNDAEKVEQVIGGTASGVCTTGTVKIVINGGNYGVVMAGGTNGYMGNGEIIINGGTVRSAQAGNRGTLGNIKITVNDGTITNAVYSGVGDTGTFVKSELHILGGNVNKVAPGKYAGTTDTAAERVSGTYVEGVIADDQAEALHLVKTTTIEKLMAKIAELEAVIA